MKKNIVAVLGGNGFVGQRVLEQLAGRNLQARCISRTGERPVHMHDPEYAWAEEVEWIQADGETLEKDVLAECDSLICLVGAPPIPRFTRAGIARQHRENSAANCRAIELASAVGIKRLAVLGAHLFAPARNNSFGYFLGKRDTLRAARSFGTTESNQATVVQPFLITGRRFLTNGIALPMDIVPGMFSPISLNYLKPVEDVATALVDAVTQERPGFHLSTQAGNLNTLVLA